MSPKTILPPDHPGVELYPARRGSAEPTNFKLKEQLALKPNQTKVFRKIDSLIRYHIMNLVLFLYHLNDINNETNSHSRTY